MSFRNLAGVKDADAYIIKELTRARIPCVHATAEEELHTEVPYTVCGEVATWLDGHLISYRFRRGWYYWAVRGPIPQAMAEMLYADPVGRTDIRVDGHALAPPPTAPWLTYRRTLVGKRLVTLGELAELEGFRDRTPEIGAQVYAQTHSECEFVADPATVGQAFVELYHIDTEVGLRLFADALMAVPQWYQPPRSTDGTPAHL